MNTRIGKIVGRVISTKKIQEFSGLPLVLIQPIDEEGNPKESVLVGIDALYSAGTGNKVIYITGGDACDAVEDRMAPIDCAVVAIIDSENYT